MSDHHKKKSHKLNIHKTHALFFLRKTTGEKNRWIANFTLEIAWPWPFSPFISIRCCTQSLLYLCVRLFERTMQVGRQRRRRRWRRKEWNRFWDKILAEILCSYFVTNVFTMRMQICCLSMIFQFYIFKKNWLFIGWSLHLFVSLSVDWSIVLPLDRLVWIFLEMSYFRHAIRASHSHSRSYILVSVCSISTLR